MPQACEASVLSRQRLAKSVSLLRSGRRHIGQLYMVSDLDLGWFAVCSLLPCMPGYLRSPKPPPPPPVFSTSLADLRPNLTVAAAS